MKKLLFTFFIIFFGCNAAHITQEKNNGVFYQINKEQDGYWRSRYPNGNIYSEGVIKKNKLGGKPKLVGLWKSFYENGNLKNIGCYNNNRQIGMWEFYDSTGLFKYRVNYTNE